MIRIPRQDKSFALVDPAKVSAIVPRSAKFSNLVVDGQVIPVSGDAETLHKTIFGSGSSTQAAAIAPRS